jgi:hypothetical protein
MTEDLTSLIEQHQRDIWEWKQKEAQWIRDKNQLDGNKQIITELSTRLVEMGRDILALKKRAQEAEGENTIIKGIGQNSPEMKEVKALNKSHQELNGKLQTRLTEVEEDNKKLSKQISDYIKNHEDKFRKAGL